MNKPRTALLCFIVVLALGTLAPECERLTKRDINKTMDKRGKAIQLGDVSGYLGFFDPAYYDDDAWLTLDTARQKLSDRFKVKPFPTLTFGKRQIELEGGQARVTENYSLEDRIAGRPRRYQGVQHLLLVQTGQGWKCKSGSEVLKLLSGKMEAEYEIEQVMLRRENALVKKDILTYMSLIAPDYEHEGQGVPELREKLLQIFRVYDDINFQSFDRKISYYGKTAKVEQRWSMQAVQMGEQKTFSGKEMFELALEPDGWKFTKGL